MSAPAVQEKKLWGTPLKLKQAEEKIVLLEAEIARLGGSTPSPQSEYPLEVWTRDRVTQEPDRWRFFKGGDEWVYREVCDFHNDSGYGSFILDRIQAMVKNSYSSLKNTRLFYERFGPESKTANGQPTGESDYSLLPKFKPGNRIEVTVRILGDD